MKNMLKRLMNVLTISTVVVVYIIVGEYKQSRLVPMAVGEIILGVVVVTSITLTIILAVNYIFFGKLTLWHKD